MPRDPALKTRPFFVRVVQHDKPELLELHPEVEREWTRLMWRRRIAGLIAGVATLGLTWMLCELLVMAVRGLK